MLPMERRAAPRAGQFAHPGNRAVVHIAGDEHYVGAQPCKSGHDALHKARATNVSEMSVGDQGCHPATPGFRQVRQRDTDPADSGPGGVHHAE